LGLKVIKRHILNYHFYKKKIIHTRWVKAYPESCWLRFSESWAIWILRIMGNLDSQNHVQSGFSESWAICKLLVISYNLVIIFL
jgi:hypothetical protein